MSTVIDHSLGNHDDHPMDALVISAAANDDHLSKLGSAFGRREATEATGGWNSYDVWRRLIKDARDRREATGRLPQIS